jgi:Asp-tRNA(Asn)/Glu-tRNA(Gln) amidotransferase A subunit family amidase
MCNVPGPASSHSRFAIVTGRPHTAKRAGSQDGLTRTYLNAARTIAFTQAWNLAGFPALSVPCGGTPTAPGAVQLVASPVREATLLAVAEQLEDATTTHQPHPSTGQ